MSIPEYSILNSIKAMSDTDQKIAAKGLTDDVLVQELFNRLHIAHEQLNLIDKIRKEIK